MTEALETRLRVGDFTPNHQKQTAVLSRKQKAAIIVRLLLAEGGNLSLTGLPDKLQAELTEEMGSLRLVDRETLRDVATEFIEELESVGMAFSGGIEGALALLDGAISSETAGRLRKRVGMRATSNPWERIVNLPADTLLPIMEDESAEVGAVILSKLSVAKAAELLSKLPGPKARRLAYSMSLTGNVTQDAVYKIGTAIAAQIEAQPESAFDGGPIERVGAILNYSPANTRDDVLKGLEETDAAFARQVRKAIFTFENIPHRIDPLDIPKIVKNFPGEALAKAIIGARQLNHTSVAEFILSNMLKRVVEQTEELMQEIGSISAKDAEEALNAFVAHIRTLEANGDLYLVAKDEEEEDTKDLA